MNADSHYIKGSTHLVCQDYALHGITPTGISYAMISDGVSKLKKADKSIPHPYSDIAARFVCLAAQDVITNISIFKTDSDINIITKQFKQSFIENLTTLLLASNIGNYGCDATLRLIIIMPNKDHAIITIGDGATIYIHEEQTGSRYSYEYSVNTPNMPINCSYLISDSKQQAYINENVIETFYAYNSHLPNKPEEIRVNLKPVFYNCIVRTGDIGDRLKLKGIIVTSDGIEQISSDNNYLPINEVHPFLFPFKNFGGDFIKRRFIGINNTLKTNNLLACDDVSMAGIIW